MQQASAGGYQQTSTTGDVRPTEVRPGPDAAGAPPGSSRLGRVARHAGPHLGLVALVFTLLKLASITVVSTLGGVPAFPGPQDPTDEIVRYFQAYPSAVLLSAFLQVGSAVPL